MFAGTYWCVIVIPLGRYPAEHTQLRFPAVPFYLASQCAALTGSYADPEVALNTGMILKEMLRYEPLAKILLYSEQ